MLRTIVLLTVALAAAAAATTRPAAPPPATRPASEPTTDPTTAPATRPAWTSVAFADPGDARRIVFVVDASRSMISQFASAKYELYQAIADLRPDDSFNVVFACGDQALVAHAAGPVPATRGNKRATSLFTEDVTIGGGSDPTAALRAAVAQRPDLVYYVTNDVGEPGDVVRTIRRLNRDVRARVDTVIIYRESRVVRVPDPDDELASALKAVARGSGGRFRMVNERALGLGDPLPGTNPVVVEEVAADPAPAAAARPATGPATRPALPDLTGYASVVFVCDPSGDETFAAVKQAADRAIADLRPGQTFGVVFLGANSPDAMSETHLFAANDARKAQARSFVRDEPAAAGRVRGWAGVKVALGLRPTAIVLICDDWLPDRDAVFNLLNDRGRGPLAEVHVVEIMTDDAARILPETADPAAAATRRLGGKFHRINVPSPVP